MAKPERQDEEEAEEEEKQFHIFIFGIHLMLLYCPDKPENRLGIGSGVGGYALLIRTVTVHMLCYK